MAYSVLPIAGIDLTNISNYNDNSAGTEVPTQGPLGLQTFGSDGLRYVFAQAGAAITASLATCTVNASTFVATASGGTYLSPATAMASGDYGWFSKASV
mgnify:CR=1 FL=1|jgi:hypothetical protein